MTNTNKDWREEFEINFSKWYHKSKGYEGYVIEVAEIKAFIEKVEQDAIQRTEEKWIKIMNSGKTLYEMGRNAGLEKAKEALSDYDWGPYDVLGTINRLIAKPSLSPEELQNNLMMKL
jgi:hypothetical protein